MTRQGDGDTAREGPRCPQCRAALYFSHVEYAGRGNEVAVLRCSSCGSVMRGQSRPRQARSSRRSRAPVDEGPPSNPVIDPEIARRLLGDE